MTPHVTRHARDRIKKRCGIKGKRADDLAEKALLYGLKHSDTTGNLKRWCDKEYFYNKRANNIRLYGDKCYIFCGEKLITVVQIPHNLIKSYEQQRKKRMEAVD